MFCLVNSMFLLQAQNLAPREQGGFVAYYFWQTDSSGAIIETSFLRPYQLNQIILPKKQTHTSDTTQSQCMSKTLKTVASRTRSKAEIRIKPEAGLKAGTFVQVPSYTSSSLVYQKTDGVWTPVPEKRFLQFKRFPNGKLFFVGSSDTLKSHFDLYTYNGPVHLQQIWTCTADGRIVKEEILNYEGQEVSAQLMDTSPAPAKRYLLFINGYRGPNKDDDETDNLTSTRDRYTYWFKIDDRFIQRLKPNATYYLDANFSVKTSVHRSKLRFGWRLFRSKLVRENNRKPRKYKRIYAEPNPEGFLERKLAGRIAAENFLLTRASGPQSYLSIDTIDVVSHSMGYAYMLGMLEALEGKVVVGKCYLIAPESGEFDSYDWNRCAEVWQYGTDLDQQNRDAVKFQDGVAPQRGVKELWNVHGDRGGRCYFPHDWPIKGFIHSHMMYSYDWIFDRIFPGMPGYVGR